MQLEAQLLEELNSLQQEQSAELQQYVHEFQMLNQLYLEMQTSIQQFQQANQQLEQEIASRPVEVVQPAAPPPNRSGAKSPPGVLHMLTEALVEFDDKRSKLR